ncbi:MAG: carbohydrate ABC transporter permease [Spirochaetaceae bacterium]|jgi:raffinose/stachyose/melibiose transport system permease protein|nr:carbohydrate ABC transporter permease [Spirochaetaceae bacterium]
MKDIRKTPSAVAVCVFMILYCVFNLFVMGYLIYNSLRGRQDILGNMFGIPASLALDGYFHLLLKDKFFRFFGNSIFILAGAIFLSVFLSSTVAYGLGHYRFRFKKAVKTYFLVGLMFPVQLGIVPVFLLMKGLRLIDTYWAVILIAGSSISMAVFLLTNFFAGLPQEIYEAAILDGSGEFRTFVKIMFPLASPVVFSMSILTAVGIWNQFFVPLIFLQSEEKKTIPLMVMKYSARLLTSIDSAFVISVLSTLPIMIMFIVFSSRILEGIAEGGIKG